MKLTDRLTNLTHPAWQRAENYLRISQTGFRVSVIKDGQVHLTKTRVKENTLLLVLKIISFATIILPLIALIMVKVYRSQSSFTEKKPFLVVKNPPYNPGMFSVFNSVVGFLHDYDKHQECYAGIRIDMGDKGVYYDPAKGPNWWQYYSKPIELGNPDNAPIIEFEQAQDYVKKTYLTEKHLSRKEVHRVIEKYIAIRPEIMQEVDAYVETNFKGHSVIGVHYRGTDKIIEAPQLAYDNAIKAINQQIQHLGHSNYKIFIATDEEQFLAYAQTAFPGKVLAKENYRATDNKPLHYATKDPAGQGKQAMIDALLLSKTDLLLRTSSNLSLWSTYFNPIIPVIELTKRY